MHYKQTHKWLSSFAIFKNREIKICTDITVLFQQINAFHIGILSSTIAYELVVLIMLLRWTKWYIYSQVE